MKTTARFSEVDDDELDEEQFQQLLAMLEAQGSIVRTGEMYLDHEGKLRPVFALVKARH
jgi:hypothetical protein